MPFASFEGFRGTIFAPWRENRGDAWHCAYARSIDSAIAETTHGATGGDLRMALWIISSTTGSAVVTVGRCRLSCCGPTW
jgi:hypothetical protein